MNKCICGHEEAQHCTNHREKRECLKLIGESFCQCKGFRSAPKPEARQYIPDGDNDLIAPTEKCKCHCHDQSDLPAGLQCRCIKNCKHCHPENFAGVCNKHGRVMLHSEKCKECRREKSPETTSKENIQLLEDKIEEIIHPLPPKENWEERLMEFVRNEELRYPGINKLPALQSAGEWAIVKLKAFIKEVEQAAEERGYEKAVDKDSVIWEKSRAAVLKEIEESVNKMNARIYDGSPARNQEQITFNAILSLLKDKQTE